MRYLFCCFVLGLPLLVSGQLADIDVDTPLDSFELELEQYMTQSGNRLGREAYASFLTSFYSGGLTTEQQQRIMLNAAALARLRAKPDGGMASYLLIHEYLGGGEEGLFDEFQEMIQAVVSQPEESLSTISIALGNAEVFLRSSRLDRRDGIHGWKVAGGTPHFRYTGDHPQLRIDSVQQLLGSTTGDSLTIDETTLLVDLASGTVNGKGGRTDWQRVGLPSDVFVRLVDYRFETDRQTITSDSAHFQYPPYFGDRILYGSFKDRLQSGGPRPAGDIPQFVSNSGFIDINNVGEGMQLRGQFELRASRVYAVGEKGREAVVNLDIADGSDGRKLKGSSNLFVVDNQERITSQRTEVTVYFGEDSLYHPSVTVDIDVPTRVASLRRSDSSTDRLPFYHSGNRFNIHANNITVFLDQDSAVVGRKTVSFEEKGDVYFESVNYYSDKDYAQVQALAGFNPLEMLYRYRVGPLGGSDTIRVGSLAQSFRQGLQEEDIKSVMFELQDRGFLTYDDEAGLIYLKPKLAHFVLSHQEAKDYDRLRLVSRTPEENAVIDLRGGTIRVDGVQPLQLNRGKQVAIKPYNEQVSIVGDRNLDFGGQVYAGAAVLTGDEFHFKYEPYYIYFDSVSYIDLFLPEGGKITEDARKLSTASRLENVSGYLLLDAPRNKSGTENIAYFPSIQTRGQSHIYYDQADTASLLRRDSFYFELGAVSLNNLDSLTQSNLALEGELVSGGIFPRMKQQLSVQDDGSLGFVGTTDTLTGSTYDGRGSYQGEVSLDNDGLAGSGKLVYMDAVIESDDIHFNMDSTTTSARLFQLDRKVGPDRSVPQVQGTNVTVAFQPYSDSMIVIPVEGTPFTVFGDLDQNFEGKMVLTPTALRGSGKLSWSEADIKSDYFTFGADEATADTAAVAIRSRQNPDEIALRTSGSRVEVDFAEQKASFVNSGGDLSTELPYVEMVTSSDSFDWDLASGNVSFATSAGKDRFTSTHPDRDSLSFVTTSARYDNVSSELRAGGVPYIISADARIYPSDSTLIVEPGGNIGELTGARIVADTANEYHVINRATVNIAGRKEYTASGYYQYDVKGHEQEFELQDIVGTRVGKGARSEKATATRATGEIAEDTEFYIDDRTRFYGIIELDAGSPALAFDGFARIEAEKLPSAEWFVVRSEGDKNNLVLSTEDVAGVDGKPLYTGLYLSKADRQIYPSLIQTPQRRADAPILDASGVFTYDEDNDRYLFGDSARVATPDVLTEGNLLIFDHANGMLSGDGTLGIGGRLDYAKLTAYGNIEMELPEQYAPEPEEQSISLTEDENEAADTTTAAPETLTDNMFLLEEEVEDAPAVNATTALDPEQARAINNYPETNLEMMAAIDLVLPDRLVQIMATDLVSGGYSAPALEINTKADFAEAGIRALFPASAERDRAIGGIPSGNIDIPPSQNAHTFLFSDLRMRWNSDYQSFVSTHQNNGLVSVGGQSLNRRIQSFLEVKMTSGGQDRLYLYIKSPSETYYFFGYKDGILNVVSSNNTFMNELRETKPKELVLEMDDGQTYEILEVTPGTAATFLRRAESAFTDTTN